MSLHLRLGFRVRQHPILHVLSGSISLRFPLFFIFCVWGSYVRPKDIRALILKLSSFLDYIVILIGKDMRWVNGASGWPEIGPGSSGLTSSCI